MFVKQCRKLVFVGLAVLLTFPVSAKQATTADVLVRIGVLARQGKAEAVRSWQPTAEHLAAVVPGFKFAIVPLHPDEVDRSIRERNIDFLITGTGQYVELEHAYSISRIATLRRLRLGRVNSRFGAVIFTRADHNTINTLADLKGHSFMAVDRKSFGGFQLAWYEMKRQGMDPFTAFSKLVFSGLPQDRIPLAVLSGEVDAGTVRTDVLERMAASGKIRLDQFRILNARTVDGFPFLLSTELQPEWPFAVLGHADHDIAKQVQLALLILDEKSPAARSSQSAGWTVPLDYSPAHKLMKALQVGPYRETAEPGLWGFLRRNGTVILTIAIITVPLFWFYIIRLFLRSRELERERKRSEEEWLHGMEMIADPTMLLDLDDRIVRANQAFYKNINKSPEEAIGRKVTDFFHPEGEQVPCKVCKARHEAKDAVITVEADEPQNQHMRPIEVTIRAVRDADGNVVRVMQSIRDLTEERRREQELAQQNRILQQIVQGTSVSSGEEYFRDLVRNLAQTLDVEYAFVSEIVDPERISRVRAFAVWGGGRFLDPVEYDLAGTPCESVVAKELCFHGEQVQELFPEDRMLSEMGVQSYLGVPFFDSNGNPLGHIAVMHNQPITAEDRFSAVIQIFADRVGIELERRLAHGALEDSERRFRGLFDSAPDSSIMVDQDGKILFVNTQFVQLFGYSKEEITDQPVEILMPDEFRGSHPGMRAAYMQRAEARAMGARPELMAVRKDGSHFYVEIALSPMNTKDGMFVVAVIRDITDRQMAERELERLASFPMMSPIPVMEVDMDGRITYENPVSSRLFPNLHLLGFDHPLLQNIDDFLPDLKAGRRSIVRDVTVDGSIYEQQLSYISETGLLRIYSWDVTNLHEMTKQMAHQASHDALTGLLNRREFEQQLERAIQSSVFDNKIHSLCYIDMDQFKVVNDTCGHNAGDELLRQLTGQFRIIVRESDCLARLGGDEFGLLLMGCPLDRAEVLAEKLRQAVSEFEFVWESQRFKVGVSVGLVGIDRSSGSLAEVLSAADSACYAAKEMGRNRIYTYHLDDKLVSRNVAEMNWTHRIRHALEHDEFLLYYQTIESLQGQGQQHCEILVRMVAPDGHIIMPGAFIPAAERFGLMGEIDLWVVSHSLDIVHAGQHSFDSYSINLSGQSLGDPRTMNRIVDLISRSDIDPGALCFEITETAMITNLSSAEKYIRVIRGMGCKFALDDFGTGLSSFSYLKTLPVDRLKIDAHFVRDIANDGVSATMVMSINVVGHAMKLSTVAEGVEDESVLDTLRELGVDFAQGYVFSRPELLSGQSVPLSRAVNTRS